MLKSLWTLQALDETGQTWTMLKALVDLEKFCVIVFQCRANDNWDWGISGVCGHWRTYRVPMACLRNSFVLSGIDFIFDMVLV